MNKVCPRCGCDRSPDLWEYGYSFCDLCYTDDIHISDKAVNIFDPEDDEDDYLTEDDFYPDDYDNGEPCDDDDPNDSRNI